MGGAFGRPMSRYPERSVVHGPTTKYSVFRENTCVLVHAHRSFSERLGYLSVQVSPYGDRRELHSFPLSCSPQGEESFSAPGLAPERLLMSCKGTLRTHLLLWLVQRWPQFLPLWSSWSPVSRARRSLRGVKDP